MKNNGKINYATSLLLPTEKDSSSTFLCPDCIVMADTCSDCCMHGSDGQCHKFGGFTDNNKWACPWYYEH